MNFISPLDLKAKIDNQDDFQLIDLREEYEFEDFNIGGTNIPLGNIFSSLDKIDQEKPVVFICSKGKKSRAVILTIEKRLKLNIEASSVKGGIPAYIEET